MIQFFRTVKTAPKVQREMASWAVRRAILVCGTIFLVSCSGIGTAVTEEAARECAISEFQKLSSTFSRAHIDPRLFRGPFLTTDYADPTPIEQDPFEYKWTYEDGIDVITIVVSVDYICTSEIYVPEGSSRLQF